MSLSNGITASELGPKLAVAQLKKMSDARLQVLLKMTRFDKLEIMRAQRVKEKLPERGFNEYNIQTLMMKESAMVSQTTPVTASSLRAVGDDILPIPTPPTLIRFNPNPSQQTHSNLRKKFETHFSNQTHNLPPIQAHSLYIPTNRLEYLQSSLDCAIGTQGYDSHYQGMYQLECNQDRFIIKDIVEYGPNFRIGLEVGLKSEILLALSCMCNGHRDAILVCNGFKDSENISLPLLRRKLELNTVIVFEQEEELNLVINLSQKMNVRPVIGSRAELGTEHSCHLGSTSDEKDNVILLLSRFCCSLAPRSVTCGEREEEECGDVGIYGDSEASRPCYLTLHALQHQSQEGVGDIAIGHDRARTESYREAIMQHQSLIEGKVVVDVGCGTGILSIFCAQAGAKRVYAVDASDIAVQAKEVVKANGLSDKVIVLHGRVEDVEINEEVDVIISEWMGYMLLYESMLGSVITARDRWLKPGGLILPSHATLYMAPHVSHPDRYSHNTDFWRNVYGINMAAMMQLAKQCAFEEPSVESISGENVLTGPEVVKHIDCQTIKIQELDSVTAKYKFKSMMRALLRLEDLQILQILISIFSLSLRMVGALESDQILRMADLDEKVDPTAVVAEPLPCMVTNGNGADVEERLKKTKPEVNGGGYREMVLGRNMHTTSLAVTEPEVNDEDTGDKEAYMASVLARYRKKLVERTKNHLGYPYNLDFDYGALGKLHHFFINNFGDPFIESNYGVHSRLFEVGVLDWFARLWEIERDDYWDYFTNCGTEGNLHGILVGREKIPDGILYASCESHYSVFKAARMYRMDCEKVGTLISGEIDCEDFRTKPASDSSEVSNAGADGSPSADEMKVNVPDPMNTASGVDQSKSVGTLSPFQQKNGQKGLFVDCSRLTLLNGYHADKQNNEDRSWCFEKFVNNSEMKFAYKVRQQLVRIMSRFTRGVELSFLEAKIKRYPNAHLVDKVSSKGDGIDKIHRVGVPWVFVNNRGRYKRTELKVKSG